VAELATLTDVHASSHEGNMEWTCRPTNAKLHESCIRAGRVIVLRKFFHLFAMNKKEKNCFESLSYDTVLYGVIRLPLLGSLQQHLAVYRRNEVVTSYTEHCTCLPRTDVISCNLETAIRTQVMLAAAVMDAESFRSADMQFNIGEI